MNQNQSRVIDIRLDGTEFAQIPSSACFLSPSLPGRMRVGGLQSRRCAVGVNKVNSCCRSVQVQSLLTKPEPWDQPPLNSIMLLCMCVYAGRNWEGV